MHSFITYKTLQPVQTNPTTSLCPPWIQYRIYLSNKTVIRERTDEKEAIYRHFDNSAYKAEVDSKWVLRCPNSSEVFIKPKTPFGHIPENEKNKYLNKVVSLSLPITIGNKKYIYTFYIKVKDVKNGFKLI